MKNSSRLTSFAWVIVLVCAGGYLAWENGIRAKRVEYISGLAEPAPVVDAASPTGYAGGLRRLIAPEHNNDSYQWIAQTQQVVANNQWRLRHVDYDNAPVGREVFSPSVYRWWLELVARLVHLVSNQPIGQAVETAALYADPLLHFLFLVGAVVFSARHFGNFAASLLAVGLVTMFPFAGVFLPGQPHDHGLSLACAWWSLLPLLAGINLVAGPRQPQEVAGTHRRARRMFFLAGLAGGIGIWISPLRQVPVLAGIFAGAIFAAWLARRKADAKPSGSVVPTLWTAWSLGGSAAVLVAFLLEYFPDQMTGLRTENVHPLYGIGWLGAGILLSRLTALLQREPLVRTRREVVIVVLAVLALAATPVVMALTGNPGFLMDDTMASRLTNLPDSAVAPTFGAWIYRDGLTAAVWATCLPALLLIPAFWVTLRRGKNAWDPTAVALAIGPVVIAVVFAWFHLRWWNALDLVLLALLVAATDQRIVPAAHPGRWLWPVGLALVIAPGLLQLTGQLKVAKGETVNENEVGSLIERDLAHWLANQSGPAGAVVLAPPNLTTSLFFHGGLAGLGTPYLENKDGFNAAIRIAGATSPDEAQAVARARNLTHIIMPSWDNFLDEYARLGSGKMDHSLVALLHGWLPPRWLQPVPYRLPKIPGFEAESVAIFQVVDVQDNATALSHLAEYFMEMGQSNQAASVSQALERLFPTDFSALIARALIAQTGGSHDNPAQAVANLVPYLKRGADRALPWDRRVSLAIALTEGKEYDLARAQLINCLAEADEPRLRLLTTGSLYRLQLMIKGFKLSFAEPQLQELARGLLPAEYREQL